MSGAAENVGTCVSEKKARQIKVGHHTRPRRASATAPLRTGVDMCKTGPGSGSSAGENAEPNRRRNNHEWMDDLAYEGKGLQVRTRKDAAGYTPQTTHQAGMPRQEPDIAASCAKRVTS